MQREIHRDPQLESESSLTACLLPGSLEADPEIQIQVQVIHRELLLGEPGKGMSKAKQGSRRSQTKVCDLGQKSA